MKLTALELENFRQFYGSQRLDLTTSQDRNVIFVWGANGAGKTTLLNAFTWVLYRSTSEGFEQPNHLINEHAWEEAIVGDEVTARVSLEFEDEGRRYTVSRATTERKTSEGSPVNVRDAAVSVRFMDEDGEDYNRDDVSAGTIEEVLPERLHRFFFFDGERIEQLVKPSAYAEIEQAIKGILGLEVVERAITHTDEARKDLERELRNLGTEKDRELADQRDAVRTKRDEKRGALEQHRANLVAHEGERQTIDDRLAQLKEASELQRQRQELEQDLEDTDSAIRASRGSLADQVGREGWLAFVDGLARQTSAAFDALRERGEIPGDMKRQFVQDLLERGRCICGAELHPGQEPYAQVAEWKERALDAEVQTAWTQLPATATGMLERRTALYDHLEKAIAELRRQREKRQHIEDKLSAISDSLRHGDSDAVKQLEVAREELGEATRNQERLMARVEMEIEQLDLRERELERAIESAEAENERAELARRRMVVARSCAENFREILNVRTAEVRRQLDSRLKELYSKISFKMYVPVLDEGFRLDLRNTEGERDLLPVAKSTGENQILSLSFVGALAEHARDRHAEADRAGGNEVLSFQGGIYPIVMDSPFGSLEVGYQERIADAIPGLAEQIIVFVSRSQGMGVVHDHMSSRIHKEYVIECHTPKPDAEPESITLPSGTYPYITVSTDGHERSELVAVRA